jgi:hypothetical protein
VLRAEDLNEMTDLRSDDRDRAEWDRNFGDRGGSSERDRNDGDPRDLLTQDLDLPRGSELAAECSPVKSERR